MGTGRWGMTETVDRTRTRRRMFIIAGLGLLAWQFPAGAVAQSDVAASSFDGSWEFVGVGDGDCNGSIILTITGGKLLGKDIDGGVSPAGVLTASGRADGKSVISTGKLTARRGSGTFKRSDGCGGRWTATKK